MAFNTTMRCAVLLLAFVAAAAAAELRGIVRANGLPVPGATVTAKQGQITRVTSTDEAGRYVISGLTPGEWALEVEMFGFAKSARTLPAPAEAETVWDLQLAQPARQPQIPSAPALARLAQLRTLTSEIQGEFEAQTSAALAPAPALQQDANESLLVTGSLSRGLRMEAEKMAPFAGIDRPEFGGPGAELGEGGPQAGLRGPISGGAAPPAGGRPGGMMGGRPGGPGGGPMGGPRMGGPGAAGRGPGGRPPWMEGRGVSVFGNRPARAQNPIRGQAFFSLNSSALDASPYSLTGNEVAKPSYSATRFGAGLGGRLRIPKLVNGESTFFFLNYSGSLTRNVFDRVATVPSPAERQGVFSESVARGPVTVYDPASGQPFPGNRIPASRIDPAAAGLSLYIPLPNQPGVVRNYRFVTPVPQNNHNLGLRLGHSLTNRDRLSFGLQFQQRHSETAQLFGFRDEVEGRGSNVNLGWTRNLTSRLINDLRTTFSRNRSETIPYFAYGPDVAEELGILGTSREPVNFGPPNLSFTNFGGLADANPVRRSDQTASVSEGLTWVRGSHSLRLGFEHRRTQVNLFTDDNGRGSFFFSGLMTSRFDGAGNPEPGTGFDMADFLLGFPQTSSVRYGNPSMYFRGSNYVWYAQDDWRIRPNLTVNAGLRYEYAQPLHEKYGRMANLDVAPGFTGVAVVTPGASGPFTGRFPEALIDADKNNVSPRIGLAWRPVPSKSLLVRGGYGLYHNASVYNQMATRLGQQPPFAFANSFTTSLANPLTLTDGLLGLPDTEITNTLSVDRGYAVGYAQTWNLALQQQLPGSLLLEVGYLGTNGTRLDTQRLPNQAPPGSPADSERRRPIPYAVGFLFQSSEGNSIYHAGQMRLVRRARRGASFQALYTWSKSIDNVSTYGGGQAVVAQNDKDLAAERGLSSFDVRHSLNLSFMLSSPVGQGPSLIRLSGWAERLLKDWNLSGGVTARSGNPLTATVLGNRADSGGTGVVGSGRADATGLPVKAADGFFNLLAFQLPPPGSFGNAGRNTIPGPGLFAANLGFGRHFALGAERRRMMLRIEAQNALNNVSYTRIGATVNASNYGLATAAAPMRTVTAMLRFVF